MSRIWGTFGLVGVMIGFPQMVQAELVSGQDIIAAPASVVDDPPGAINTKQQAFNEAQSVVLAADLNVDGGVIPAGTIVDSHMIFLNTDGFVWTTDITTWGFDGEILGVMSDRFGNLEVASSPTLGAAGTTYPAAGFNARGMEGYDRYTVTGSSINVRMRVWEPGDWIRVVTRAHFDAEIDIKPGSDPNSINLRKKGLIAIAVFTTDELDALSIDDDTVEFGDPVLGGTAAPVKSAIEDVDGDGSADLVLHFSVPDLVSAGALDADSEIGMLTGQTAAGNTFSGIDSVRIVPPKK